MLGIDVSNHNGTIAWEKVKAAGAGFAHAKATEGLSYFDPYFFGNRGGARKQGIPFGAYHFGHPELDPIAQAHFFASKVGRLRPGDLRPALDLEMGTGSLTVWAGRFLSETERLLGVRPILYSYSSFIRSHLDLKALAGYPLWLADYGPNDGREHPASIPYVEHQFTSSGSFSGVPGRVDLDSASSLSRLLVPGPEPTPKVPLPSPSPEPKNGLPFVRKAWPVPVPHWFWAWAQWRRDGKTYARPLDAPLLIPPWAWARLSAL